MKIVRSDVHPFEYFNPDVSLHPCSNRAIQRMSEVHALNKELTMQALALLPFQGVLAAALGTSINHGKADGILVGIGIALLGLSLSCTASTLSRINYRPPWTVKDADALITREARWLVLKGFDFKIGVWLTLAAALVIGTTAALTFL